MQSQLSEKQAARFTAGLLKPTSSTPADVVGPNGKAADKRYNVYRNNVTVSLINALADIYPATLKIVGDEFFRALAREYVREHPPKSPLLFLYGADFSSFVASFEHTQHLPYLPDVARLERAWLTAYHAADVEPLNPALLASIAPERTGQLIFNAKPGTAIINSSFPVFTIYAMNRDMMPLGKIDLAAEETALITRPDADVVVTPLDRGEALFLSELLENGRTLEQAASFALEVKADFNINDTLAKLFGTGAAMSAEVAPTNPTTDAN
ncbi:MAG: DNA-binding domain-containing protein [Pseudomonadota bacterium]